MGRQAGAISQQRSMTARTRLRRWPPFSVLPMLALLALPSLLTGCAEEPLPERRLTRLDCLRDVRIDRLSKAIARCDQVVAAYPEDPAPLNDRFLLHSLAGDNKRACRDIARAVSLAARRPRASRDPLLRSDLANRQASCRDDAGVTSERSSVAPAPAAPAADRNPSGARTER